MDDTATSSQSNFNDGTEVNNDSVIQTTEMTETSESSPTDNVQVSDDTAYDSLAKELNNKSRPPEEVMLKNGSPKLARETEGQRNDEDTNQDESKSHEDTNITQVNDEKSPTATDNMEFDTDHGLSAEGDETQAEHRTSDTVLSNNEGDNISEQSGNVIGNTNQSVDEHTNDATEGGQNNILDNGSKDTENAGTAKPESDEGATDDQGDAPLAEPAHSPSHHDTQLTQRSEEELKYDEDLIKETEGEDNSRAEQETREGDGDITQRSQQGDPEQLTDDSRVSENTENSGDGNITARSQQENNDTSMADTGISEKVEKEEDGGNFTINSQEDAEDSRRDPVKAEEDVYLETYRRDSFTEEGGDINDHDTTGNHVDNQHPEISLTEQDTEQMDDMQGKEDQTWDEPLTSRSDQEKYDHMNEETQDNSSRYEPQDHSHMKEDSEDRAEEEETEGPSIEELREQEEFSKKLDSTENGSISVTERLELISEMLDAEREHLLQTPLKDYERLERLSSVIQSSKVICKDYESHMLQMSGKIQQVYEVINAINKTVERKITNEGVLSWAEQLKTDPSDPESVAREKQILAQAAEAREALGKASCEIPRAEERAAELTAQTVEAALTATKAEQAAEEARVAAEIAKKAAEQRRLEQEEARRKAEEAKRRQEEMERLRQEEEERKRREEELLLQGTPEERERIREEVERRNPKNWPLWVYSVDPGNTGIPVGCVIRCLPGVTSRDLFVAEKLDQLSGVLPLESNEELVSNIIKITHEDPNFKTMEPLCIAIPHCAPRINSRECVVKMMQPNGAWVEVGTSDAMFEDMREYKFSECKLQKTATLAVVTRIKREQHTVHKRGGKVVPSVDTRICFTVRQSMFKVSTTVSVEVFPVDSTLVADLRNRKEHCEGLLACSPLVRFHTPLRKFSKPVMVNVPLPQNPAKQKRPTTAAANKLGPGANDSQSKTRPTSAFMAAYARQEEEEEDQVHLLTKDNEGEWVVVEGVHLVQPKNKDIITFEMEQPLRKFMVLRCKPEVTFTGLERIAASMEEIYTERVVQFVLRQKDEDAGCIEVHCAPVPRIEGIVRKLAERGYNYGPLPSQDIILHEGQAIKMRYRGNVIGEENEESLSLVYNTHIKTIATFRVTVKDTFAQKSIECYRGFCQIYFGTSEAKPDDMSTSAYLQKQLKTELLINLPKPEPEAPKAIVERAPVQVKTDGLVNKDLLHQVAADLGDEWKRLAQQLSIKRMRIQAIMRNNVGKDTEHVIYEMLLTWMKRVPKSANKVEMLCNALLAIGRVDIAEVIKDKELDFKKERALSNRDSYLRKAFVQIAQSPYIVSDWKFLGRQLEVREMDLAEVDEAYSSMREKCFHSLIRWREVFGMDATPSLLIETLRKCKYNHVADQVQETLKSAL